MTKTKYEIKIRLLLNELYWVKTNYFMLIIAPGINFRAIGIKESVTLVINCQ